MMQPEDKELYEFGAFRLDLAQRILLHHGEPVGLQPKAFETLLALLEKHGQVVSRDELMERIWPDTFVEETNLEKNISILRSLLKDCDCTPSQIKTIPKRGYCFTAEVRLIKVEPEAQPIETAQVTTQPTLRAQASCLLGLRPEFVSETNRQDACAPAAPRDAVTNSARRSWRWGGLALALVAAATMAWVTWLRSPRSPQPITDEFAPVRLTYDLAIDHYPAYSPDGKKIAFNSNRDGWPTIYVMNADGSEVRKLVNGLTECYAPPAWSADGTKVYFSTKDAMYQVNADGSGLATLPLPFGRLSPDGQKIVMVKPLVAGSQASVEIFVAQADGSHPRRLTHNQALDADPFWSPDSQRIAFTCFPDGFVEGEPSNPEICAMNADGSHLVRLTNHPAQDSNPIWSPDGTRMAFYSLRNCQMGGAIRVMNADGTNDRQLTECENLSVPAGWSPDSQKIIYASNRVGNVELYTINADPSHQTNLTRHAAEDTLPVWSPDGKQIAFVSNRDGPESLFVMQADGSHQRKVISHLLEDCGPSWSPDGKKIAFTANWEGHCDIYVANADGGNIVRLTRDPQQAAWPVWSPAGKKILYFLSADQINQLYVMNADGSGVTRVSNSSESEWQHDWSPDGRQIIFTRSRHQGVQRDIWLMKADGSAPRLLAEAPGHDEFVFPRFSPDGRQIAFQRRDAATRQWDVWIMKADGSGPTRLTFQGGVSPAWSPDGKKLTFYTSRRDGNAEIYVMDVAGQ